MTWPLVAVLMIAEIVSNGMLSLPSSLAVVGIVPGVIVIVFLGVFATFTSWLLIQFKLRHPQGERGTKASGQNLAPTMVG
jgi:amino acid permease